MQHIFIVSYKHVSLEKFMMVHFYLLESLKMGAFLLKFSLTFILILYSGSW